MYHGKITREDHILDSAGNSYRVTVKVNDVVKTERDPHYNTGGDYTINYALGHIIFNTALNANDVVKVTYHYENGSTYIITPPSETHDLSVDSIDLQVSSDLVITDSICYQVFGLVDVVAPQLVGTGQGQIPSGTMIPLNEITTYKTFLDYLNDTQLSYPVYPAVSSGTWRGSPTEIYTYNLNYLAAEVVPTIAHPEIRMWLEHHTPFGGTSANATFFCQLSSKALGYS
jgi:hypothetical protein